MLPSVGDGLAFLMGGDVSGSSRHGRGWGPRRRTEAFIVRLWAEYLEQTPPSWRGEIQHVESGEVRRFATFGEMTDFIRRRAVAPLESNECG